MVFNSLTFLVFITVFLLIYFSLTGRARLWVCLIGSYLFYGWWDWRFLGLIGFTTLMDYTLGILMAGSDSERYRKRLIYFSVTANLLFLGFFKYFNFFADSFRQLVQAFGFHPSDTTLTILLPIGISFYTFQSMSYTVDIYRREIEPERDLVRFAAFVSLFPQLVAGPIVRAKDFLPQFKADKRWDWDRFMSGLTRVLWGFFKKVAIADSLAPFVEQCFSLPATLSSLHILLGIIFYSFQIYCDFSGYSDIAIGLARILGFTFVENFKTPYFSRSFTEFWTRWHISLSSWLRDYLYIPLGGNRGGKLKTYRNMMITMLIGGLWHGANWTFLFWGFLHGSYQVIQRLIQPYGRRFYQVLHLPVVVRQGLDILLVYSLTCFAWIYFRSPTFAIADQVIHTVLSFEDFNWSSVINKFTVIKGVLLIAILLTIEVTNFRLHYAQLLIRRPVLRLVAYACIFWIIALMGTFGANSFIYFQF
ncbi:MBOAT family O-acyltransferase [Spirosoma fluviale]|uniref:D-alanyl-lipoteichoic acid acyltransferase DltB, MBOAT superfamily n=1 Tax=Spirosoma fluviale TaxID=1597977 RepID=A0A286GCB0_9BACT|nr:MBOAT family O-acyltransferase [Spirosoma fluviale]SOD93128.1 D-alanyl-lipoteichoic acid acyltransferase DltB, MBOAT superfamily [Spirosoma fluviale]